MISQRHYIGRQVFEISFPRGEDPLLLQQQFGSFIHEAVEPAFEKLFNEVIPPDEIVRIDRIELDLGTMPTSGFMTGEMVRKLIAVLREHILDGLHVPGSKPDIRRQPVPEGMFERWLVYLQNGNLPVPLQGPESAWKSEILAALVKNYVLPEQFSKLFNEDIRVRHRLIHQHDDEFLCALFEIYTGKKQEALIRKYLSLWKIFKEKTGVGLTQRPVVQHDQGARLLMEKGEFRFQFWDFISEMVIAKNLRSSATQLAGMFRQEHFNRMIEAAGKGLAPGALKERDPKGLPENQDNALTGLMLPDDESDVSGEDAAEWYIEHAGMVLLHPFLTRFFDYCGLLTEGAFTGKTEAEFGVHLIHYLVTGMSSPPEYDLLLAKVICGLPVNGPVKRFLELEDDWKAEADRLLEVVIQEWQVLGDVSGASLREAFLMRPGKLSRSSSGWLLQVEQHTIDILLDRLPWGYSMFRLPWMKDLMRVEWR